MKIKYLDFGAKTRPHRSYTYDAGMDIHLNEDLHLEPHETKRIPLGFGLKIPPMYAGFVIMRSSYATKGLSGGFSAIDCGYDGEISLIVTNLNDTSFDAKAGERICSLIVFPTVIFDWTDEVTSRHQNGFGSTGNR